MRCTGERRGEAPRGVLFVTGQRFESPWRRTQPTAYSLRVAAETMRSCIAPKLSPYDAVAANVSGDDDAPAPYQRRLVETAALLH